MNILQKELQALKAKVAELESRIVAEPPRWVPKGGNWYVECDGVVKNSQFPSIDIRFFGTERVTKEQAKRAAVEMRRFNRLLALRDELCGDEEVDWDNNAIGYYLYFSYYQNRWNWSSDERCESIQPYFTTEESVQRACDMLNSGEVEL